MTTIRKTFRYAAAAAVIAILVIAGFLFNNNKPADTGTANVSSASSINVAAALDKLSDEEIVEYLQATGNDGNFTSINTTNDDLDIQEEIDELSTEELQEYLKDSQDAVNTGSHGI